MPANRNEPGPSWDPRPAWQRLSDGTWRTIFERRAVETEQPAMVVPIVGNRPFRIPRAMLPVAVQKAPALQPLTDPTPGKLLISPCKKALNYNAPASTLAQDRQFIATLDKVIAIVRRSPGFAPSGFETQLGCTFERRTDTTGIYRGKITLLFYPYSNKNHYWAGGLEILINDLGVMGPHNNREDRASDPTVVFPLPAPARYLEYPFLDSDGAVWGGLYLTRHPTDIYTLVTYRQWLAENLSRLESEYQKKKAEAEGSRLVHYQVVRNNFQSMYERALFTSKYMPPAELDSPLWLSGLSPSDAADPSAARQVRLNVPAYFNRRQPLCAIQLINILPLSTQYNHVHVVLQNLDLKALTNLVE